VIRKKICMLGASSVGKTSLVRQFVDSMFDERYQRTIGVKIDKKVVPVNDQQMTMMLWDMQGEDDQAPVRDSYLRGLDGYLLVLDSTRPDTVEIAQRACDRIRQLQQNVPYLLVSNKSDLVDDWSAIEQASVELSKDALGTLRTSAKTGDGVEECFQSLANSLL